MSDAHATKAIGLYADDFGESRFEAVTIPMLQKEFAPPAAPLHVTDAQPAQHYVVGDTVIRGWRLFADGGYIGQRSYYRGHIAPTGQGGNDPPRIAPNP